MLTIVWPSSPLFTYHQIATLSNTYYAFSLGIIPRPFRTWFMKFSRSYGKAVSLVILEPTSTKTATRHSSVSQTAFPASGGHFYIANCPPYLSNESLAHLNHQCTSLVQHSYSWETSRRKAPCIMRVLEPFLTAVAAT